MSEEHSFNKYRPSLCMKPSINFKVYSGGDHGNGVVDDNALYALLWSWPSHLDGICEFWTQFWAVPSSGRAARARDEI